MGINFFEHTYEELSELGVDFDTQKLLVGEKAWGDHTFNYTVPFVISSFHSRKVAIIDRWCMENLSGFFKVDWSLSSFEKEEDAMAFKLAWF